jgi:ABC-2 type transport system ATP-binding protein
VLLCSHLLGQVQEVCDRVGILHHGQLLQEGRIDDLTTVSNQTQLVLENVSPDLLAELQKQAERGGAKVICESKPQADLEQFFLKVTQKNS